MAPSESIARLGGWVGYGVEDDWLEDRAGVRRCVIRLQLEPGRPRRCDGCGAWVSAVHDVVERRVKDLPIFEHPVELIMPRVRVACPTCGPRLERLPWLAPWARVTTRLAANVARLCSVMSIRHVANFYALDWKTVKTNAGYAEEVRAQCPKARIVYDLFHVVAKYGREVIDRVRVDEANRLRADKKARQVGYALRVWRQWYRRAMRSGIEPLRRFARNLKPYLRGILANCQWPLGTNLIEGINNKIKVIKRMAYGYRDDAYFFLKIRAAFPGNGR